MGKAHSWVGEIVVSDNALPRVEALAKSYGDSFDSTFVFWVGEGELKEHIFLSISPRPNLGYTLYRAACSLTGSTLPKFVLCKIEDVLALERAGRVRRYIKELRCPVF